MSSTLTRSENIAATRILAATGGILAAAIVGIIVWVAILAGGAKEPQAAPIVVGDPDAPVMVDLYFDYMCPGCGQFDRTNAPLFNDLVDSGTIRVGLHPMAFLDDAARGSRYSTRAANALLVVGEKAPGSVLAFHQAVFTGQPQEGTSGLNDDEIEQFATAAGVPADIAGTFKDLQRQRTVADLTRAAADSGITQTPTVIVNGVRYTGGLTDTPALRAAIEQAAENVGAGE